MDSLKWIPASSPLKAVGLIIAKDAKVIQRLLGIDNKRILRLRGSYSSDSILLLSEEASLPWIPNATYLGQDISAPNILIPTNLTPNIPVDWLARAIELRFGEGRYAVDPMRHEVYNVSKALNVSVGKLGELLNEVT